MPGRSVKWLVSAAGVAMLCSAGAGGQSRPAGQALAKWVRRPLRVVTYEFLERAKGGTEQTPAEIVGFLDRVGGADVLLCKGFQYYRGVFDDSSGGYPRYRAKIAKILPLAHRRGVKVGVFGFTHREKTYRGQQDHAKVLGVWGRYVREGIDLLFVDEESGQGGLDIPDKCLAYCGELRRRFRRPVGLFVYGGASRGVGLVRKAAGHVDVLAEMSYSAYLDKPGDYNLARITKLWSRTARGVRPEIAYWTGAGIFGAKHLPGLPGSATWRDRYGDRDESQYLHDYLKTAIDHGATGVFFHSICRTTWWSQARRKKVIDGVKRAFAEVTSRRPATARPKEAPATTGP